MTEVKTQLTRFSYRQCTQFTLYVLKEFKATWVQKEYHFFPMYLLFGATVAVFLKHLFYLHVTF